VHAASADGRLGLLRHTRNHTHHLLDLDDGAWLEAPQGGFPRGVVSQQPEVAFVVDVPGLRARAVEVAGPKLSLAALAPDQRFAWVADPEGYGGIYDCASGALAAWPVLDWLEPREESDPADDLVRHVAAAFVRLPDGRFRFFTGGRVIDGHEAAGQAGRALPAEVGEPLAAAFAGSGARLLVVTDGAAWVLAIADETITVIARHQI
jgi:hypothetical protein